MEDKLLEQIQTLVNKGDFDTQTDIDVFLDIMGAFNGSPKTEFRLRSMIDYCIKKRDGLDITYEAYLNTNNT